MRIRRITHHQLGPTPAMGARRHIVDARAAEALFRAIVALLGTHHHRAGALLPLVPVEYPARFLVQFSVFLDLAFVRKNVIWMKNLVGLDVSRRSRSCMTSDPTDLEDSDSSK